MSSDSEPLNCGFRGRPFPVLRNEQGRMIRESFFAARLRLGLEETAHLKGVIYPCEKCFDKGAAVMDNRTRVYWCLACALDALGKGYPLTEDRPLTDFTELDVRQAHLYRSRLPGSGS